MQTDTNQDAFFELVRAGLFPEREFKGSKDQEFKEVDWEKVFRLAEEQSVKKHKRALKIDRSPEGKTAYDGENSQRTYQQASPALVQLF